MSAVAGIIRNQRIEVPRYILSQFEGKKVLVTILDQETVQSISNMDDTDNSLHFGHIQEWSDRHIEVTDELIKQRREVLQSRCCVRRTEWGQGNIDEWLRNERDEDRF